MIRSPLRGPNLTHSRELCSQKRRNPPGRTGWVSSWAGSEDGFDAERVVVPLADHLDQGGFVAGIGDRHGDAALAQLGDLANGITDLLAGFQRLTELQCQERLQLVHRSFELLTTLTVVTSRDPAVRDLVELLLESTDQVLASDVAVLGVVCHEFAFLRCVQASNEVYTIIITNYSIFVK